MAITTKRIINLDTASTIASTDYIVLDSSANGTRKYLTAGKSLSTNDYTDNEKAKVASIDDIQAVLNALTIYDTASGSIATFDDGAAYPLKSCTAEINAVQSGSGTPSPDNVRPISGFSSVLINVAGRNLFDTSDIVDGTIYASNGQNATGSGTKRTDNYIPVKGGATYTISGLGGTVRLYQYKADKSYIGNALQSNGSFTPDTLCAYFRIAGNSVWVTNSLMMRVSSDSDSTFEAYDSDSTTTTISLGSTIYGGTLDVVTGVLTVDKVGVDLGTLTWTAYGATSSYDRYITSGIDSTAKEGTVGICSHFQGSLAYSAGNIVIGSGSSKLSVFTEVGQYASASAFKTAMSGAYMVYELATPTSTTATATEITALSGTNNIWADSGDVSVEYLVNIGLRL